LHEAEVEFLETWQVELLELMAFGFEDLEAGLKGTGVAGGAWEGGQGGEVTDAEFGVGCNDF
jgi:hypothetical protein